VFFDPWNRGSDPGYAMEKKSGSGMNIPDNFSESLLTGFWVKNTVLIFFDADLDSGSLTRDPGWKNSDPGSGINIPDPQHCL